MRRFVCRMCGEVRVPAFPDSHVCSTCWADWEAQNNEFPAEHGSAERGTPAASSTGHGPALPVRVSLGVVAEKGGHWCMQCRHYVSPVVSDQGLPNRCPHCDGFHLKFHPPVPGYAREVVA